MHGPARKELSKVLNHKCVLIAYLDFGFPKNIE